jgi:hypothetical protein
VIGRRAAPFIVLVLGIALIASPSISGCTIDLPSVDWFAAKHPDAWMIFVEESADRDLDFAVMLQNKKFTDSLKDREINYRVYDKDQPEAKSYLQYCQEWPSVVFVTPEGKLVKASKAPRGAKEADRLIAEVMGK